MAASMRIINDKVYGLANGIDDETKKIDAKNAKVVDTLAVNANVIDAHSIATIPRDADIHCHIASPKVNVSRKRQSEDHLYDIHTSTSFTRSGSRNKVPSAFAKAYCYANFDYTTAKQAAEKKAYIPHTQFRSLWCQTNFVATHFATF